MMTDNRLSALITTGNSGFHLRVSLNVFREVVLSALLP
jgi:hypothetical protein